MALIGSLPSRPAQLAAFAAYQSSAAALQECVGAVGDALLDSANPVCATAHTAAACAPEVTGCSGSRLLVALAARRLFEAILLLLCSGNKADARLIMVPCRTLTARMCRAWFSKEAGRDSAGSWLRMRASRQLCALALGTLPAVLARAEMLPMSSLVRASGPAAALPSQHLLVPGAWDLAKHCRFADMLMDFIGQSKVQAMRRVNA